MNMNQVESILKRPRLYYNIDGVGELSCGVMCLGFALLLWLQAHTPGEAIWHQMYGFAIYMGIMLGAIHYGSRAIKTHITYPRTGFVEYRKCGRWRTATIAAVVGGLVPLGLTAAFRRNWDIASLASLCGLIVAAGYIHGFARTARWKWVIGGAMTLASLVMAFLPPSFFGELAADSWVTHPVRTKLVGVYLLTLMIYGTMLLVSGGISLWLYVRHTQAPAQENQ
jgi:hypothetical protein